MAKYGNRKAKANIDGKDVTFDSVVERDRYNYLALLQKAGEISSLEIQKRFELIPNQPLKNGKVERKCCYNADFCYIQDGETVVEDTKGYKRTADYIVKRKLMLQLFGVEIREVERVGGNWKVMR